MIRAYLYALDPTDAQVAMFRSHCGAQRYAYNFGLELVRANLDQRAAERSYGITDDQLTPAVSWSALSLRRAWNEAKHDAAPWWRENSKEAYSSGLANLATALSNWSASKSGKRAGRKVAFPRFRSRRSRLTCRFTTGACSHDTIVIEDLHVAGMVRNHRLARSISQLGIAEFRRQIEYKATDAGVRVVLADRWYPSSKTCSACGAVKAKLSLAERKFVCESCGTRLDRDVNAAMNLAALADQAVSGQSRPDVKRPAGNPRQTATGGNGYRHGKTQIMSQRRPREEATP